MSAVSKPGKHGTLYLYLLRYKDKYDDGSPEMEQRIWAYNMDHAEEKFFDTDDKGWKLISIERVQDSAQHRAKRHNISETRGDVDRNFAGYDFTTGPKGTKIRREHIDTNAPGDYGADPLGDGTFRMIPSGDVVDFVERNRRLEKRGVVREAPRRARKSARFSYRHEDDLVTDPTMLPGTLADRYEHELRARGLQVEVTSSKTIMPRGWDYGNITDLIVNGEQVSIRISVAKGNGTQGEASGVASVGAGLGRVIATPRASTPEPLVWQLVDAVATHFGASGLIE